MKRAFLLLGLPFLLAGKCGDKKEKKQDQAAIPACVQKLIDEAAKPSPPTTPIQVDEYIFKGKKTYLFQAGCCDFFNIVVDENCNQLCAPSGGITGRGDGKCPDFDSLAKHVKMIWTKKVE